MKEWIPGWGYRETDFSLFPIYAENETQRLWFYNNLYSDTLRLRFSNRYGRETLPLEQVSISLCTEQGRIEPDTSVTVRFCGKPGVRLEPGQVLCSDSVEFHAEPGTWISVSLYIKEKTRITCAISSQSLPVAAAVKHITQGFPVIPQIICNTPHIGIVMVKFVLGNKCRSR